MKKISYSLPEHIYEITVLRDIYEGLLPPRQKQVAHLKLDEDLSLSEMAEKLGITRQGCDDALKRCVRALFTYENKLGFKRKLSQKQEIINVAKELVKNMNSANYMDMRKRLLEVLENEHLRSET